jgi:hypothetical protein
MAGMVSLSIPDSRPWFSTKHIVKPNNSLKHERKNVIYFTSINDWDFNMIS